MKKSILKQLLVMLTAFTLVLGFGVSSVNVYAAISKSTELGTAMAKITTEEGEKDLADFMAKQGYDTNPPSDESGYVYIIVDNKKYYLTRSDVSVVKTKINTIVEGEGKAAAEAKNSTKTAKEHVKNMMDEFEVTANTGQAAVALAGIQQLVGVIVGILAYAVVIGMSLFTGVDICYITMPVFRNWADDKGASGGAVTSSTNKDTGESKFRFVTDEAMFAVTQATVENGKNALGIYFKKRCIGWILTAIVLYVLLTGQIVLLTDVILQFISGIIAALQSLGN